MSPQMIGVVGMLALLVLIFIRVPVAIALALVGMVGYAAIEGWGKALLIVGTTPFEVASGYALSVLPLFILMGQVTSKAGMATKMFEASKAIFNGFKGSESMATIGACAGFGAICGSSLATAATMSQVAIPEMRKCGYDDRLSAGVVAAGGTLGILIPPSIIFVIYAVVAQQSLLKLFAAGLLPALLLTLLYLATVLLVIKAFPGWARGDDLLNWPERLRRLTALWEIAFLFGLSIGGMYLGWFSPTEGAAIGAFTAIALSMATGRLTPAGLWECAIKAVQTTAMLLMIIIGAYVFSYFTVLTQVPTGLAAWVRDMGLPPLAVMTVLVLIYIVLGCFLDGIGMILVTVPIFFPLVVENGFDPIWFGVLLVVVIEVGLIHPPLGMNLFVIRAQIADIKLKAIYLGTLPFLAAQGVLIVLLLLFPRLATWLPEILYTP